jgi:IS5 family transposase
MAKVIPSQADFRPVLPTVLGNVDYQRFETELRRMDQILDLGGAERLFVELSLEQWLARSKARAPSAKQQARFEKQSAQALRCVVLKQLLGEDLRGMSRRLAECALFQWFCGVDRLDAVRVPSKSQLARYMEWLPRELLDQVISRLIRAAAESDGQDQLNRIGLANDLELDRVWIDSTCVEANIHFPTDWVLLRDATRTLMKATALIRRHGLKHRMRPPESFLTEINRQSIAMTQAAKAEDSKKARKRVLRRMKGIVQIVRWHARRHRDLLDREWEQTDWTRSQAEVVLRRMDGVLEQLPAAVKQAHERIIGERQVPNADKILSLYEADLHVVVRGKAGKNVEFGNTLTIVEQAQGLVVDWYLHQQKVPADAGLLVASLERIEKRLGAGTIRAMGGDRGFDSLRNRQLLESKKIFNGLCPRGAEELRRRRHSPRFGKMQRRRSQTEGRIAILKNGFFGKPMRAKSYEHRGLAVSWNVLAHNLWVLGRLETLEDKAQLKEAA